MTDKKLTDNLSNDSPILSNGLTDNEIVKALEKMRENLDDGYTTCLDYGGKRDMQAESDIHLYGLVIDLINRLQEKNSNLTSDLTSLQNDLTSAKAEVENLKNELGITHIFGDVFVRTKTLEDYYKFKKSVKIEAYKEFAERLRSIIMWSPKNHISITAKDVEMILRELAGEDNAS